jgi:hypothetical protein
MQKKAYEAPKVFELGTVAQLTEKGDLVDKCAGSAEVVGFLPLDTKNSDDYGGDCPGTA